MPNTRLVLGLRDIVDSPDVVRRLWEAEDVYNLLEHGYDQILVYGNRELFDVAEAYRLPAEPPGETALRWLCRDVRLSRRSMVPGPSWSARRGCESL